MTKNDLPESPPLKHKPGEECHSYHTDHVPCVKCVACGEWLRPIEEIEGECRGYDPTKGAIE